MCLLWVCGMYLILNFFSIEKYSFLNWNSNQFSKLKSFQDDSADKFNRQRVDYPREDYNGGYDRYRTNAPPQLRQPPPVAPVQEDKNDCEIICVSKGQRQYAEMIESRWGNRKRF